MISFVKCSHVAVSTADKFQKQDDAVEKSWPVLHVS